MSATLRDAAGRRAPIRDDLFPTDDLGLREAMPTVARGHNVVAVLPPDAAYGVPLMAALVDRLTAAGSGQALMLCPPAGLAAWGAQLRALTAGGPLRLAVAPSSGRLVRRLREASADIVVTTPDTALGLVRRSALALERVTAMVLVWPEAWDDPAELAPLMQDLPRDTQRLVLTGDPAHAAELTERYAHKALTVGLLAGDAPPAPPVGPVRLAVVTGRDRRAALVDALELLDPAEAVVWAAGADTAAEAAAQVVGDPTVRVVTGDAPKAPLIIAYDIPGPARLAQLIKAGETVLLAPPLALPYLERIAHPRRPLRLPGTTEQVSQQAAAHRATLARLLEERTAVRGVLTLAPLFERYDAAAVAGALYELWTAEAAEAPAPAPEVAAVARIFVAVGRKDGATANDLVATLIKEVGLAREKIGRIELKDTFSLVEVPARDAETVAAGLNGRTIRRRRITARVDQGPSHHGRKR